MYLYLFFFFQAEDGIRDLTVTGVQTCALPISCEQPPRAVLSQGRRATRVGRHARGPLGVCPPDDGARPGRLADAHAGSVCRATPTRYLRIPHSALRISLDLRRRLLRPPPPPPSGPP